MSRSESSTKPARMKARICGSAEAAWPCSRQRRAAGPITTLR
ncbi:MAG: hypothetical protein ABIS86_14755 [Streptosporangiaceae bacterium]